MPKAPLDQAHACCRALLSKFVAHRLPPPAIGQAVIFPDQEFDKPPTQGDLEGVVIGARQLPYLKELVHDLMRKAIPLQYKPPPRPRLDRSHPRTLVRGLAAQAEPGLPGPRAPR